MLSFTDHYAIMDHPISEFTYKALNWVKTRLDLFNPLANLSQLDEMTMKAFVEFAFLCTHALRLKVLLPQPWFKDFTDYLFNIFESHDMAAITAENQQFIMVYTMFQELYEVMGIPNPGGRDFIQLIVDGKYTTHVERVPYRRMDLRYSLDRVQIQHNLPSMRKLYADTILANRPQVPSLDTSDMYSITHTIFYLTDMGQTLPDWMPLAEIKALRNLNRILMGRLLREKDLDVLGELLICHYQLRDVSNFNSDFAWHRLLQAQHATGAVPSPIFCEEEWGKLSGLEANKYEFTGNYHTTLVAIMAGLLWMREQQHSPTEDKPND